MKAKLLFIGIFFFFVNGIVGQITWVQKADVGNGDRSGAAAFSIGNYGYVGTGDDQFPNKLDDFWQYNPVSDTWIQKSNFAGAARSSGGFGFNITTNTGTYGYVGLGWNNSTYFTDFWQYDPSSDTWSQMANFPSIGRVFSLAVSVGAYGYVGLGGNWAGVSYKNFWQYDAANNTWTAKADFPDFRSRMVRFVLNGSIYAGCGESSGSYYSDLWKYDTTANAWSQKADFPGSIRSGTVSLAVGGYGYAGLGSTGNSAYYTDFWKYDPTTDNWSPETTFPGIPRVDGVAFNIGDTGYVGTGYHNFGNPIYHKDFWAFYPTAAPVATFTPSDTIFCGEGQRCIDFFDLSSGNPTSWQWLFPGAVPSTSSQKNPSNVCYYNNGVFPVTLIVTNAAGTDTLTVSPMVIFSPRPNPPMVTLKNDTLTSSSGFQYQWFLNGVPISAATDSFFIAHQSGTYAVEITDSLGCSSLSTGIGFNSVNELADRIEIKIYPNPLTFSSILQLSEQVKNAEVVIYDMLGKEILKKNFSGNKTEIEKGNLAGGIYFVRVNAEEKQFVQKIIVE